MNFETAVDIVISNEGGLVEHPNDPGGLTKFGISLRSYPQLGRNGITNLTLEAAKKIYFDDYWMKSKCDVLPEIYRLAIFDASVNHGVFYAAKSFQKILHVEADGIIGPVTVRAANRVLDPRELLARLFAARARDYFALPQFSVFGEGWLVRLFQVAQRCR